LGESGELIGEIITGNPGREFAGYHGNKEGTEKKVVFFFFFFLINFLITILLVNQRRF